MKSRLYYSSMTASMRSRDIAMEENHWYPINVSSLVDGTLRLTPEPMTTVSITIEYDGRITIPTREEYDPHDRHNMFPEANPLFNRFTLQPGRPYRFEIDFCPPSEILTLRKALQCSPKTLRRAYRPRGTPIDSILPPQGKTFVEVISSLEQRLDAFIISAKREDVDKVLNYNVLREEYTKEGYINGDCKAFSTTALGILSCWGLIVRRLSGSVQVRESGRERLEELAEKIKESEQRLERYFEWSSFRRTEQRLLRRLRKEYGAIEDDKIYECRYGHTWAEVYVPRRCYPTPQWIPIDNVPKLCYGTDPDREHTLESDLPRFEGESDLARIKIESFPYSGNNILRVLRSRRYY